MSIRQIRVYQMNMKTAVKTKISVLL